MLTSCMLLYPLSALICHNFTSFLMSSAELFLWYLLYRCAWPNYLNVCSSRNSNHVCASFLIIIYISHLIKHCLLLSIATCTCPLYVKPALLLTEQYSAPYVMAGVISCTVCLYICFGMSHSRIVSCQVDRDFFILLFSYFSAPPIAGNNEPRQLNCFPVWCRHVWSLCRWFGHFLAESYTAVLCFSGAYYYSFKRMFLSRSCNSKLSPFSCSSLSSSMMIN